MSGSGWGRSPGLLRSPSPLPLSPPPPPPQCPPARPPCPRPALTPTRGLTSPPPTASPPANRAGENLIIIFTPLSDKMDYTFHDKLGEGGFGSVFRATQKRTGKEVAIKFVKKSKASIQYNLPTEAVILRKLNLYAVTNIIRLYNCIETKNHYLLGKGPFNSLWVEYFMAPSVLMNSSIE